MGGALMQLVAYGAQDIYLTGQPQITFFKAVYRRYTNFAIESIPQVITGTPVPGDKITVSISRNGDLLKNLYMEFNPNTLFTLPILTGKYPNDQIFVNVCSDFGHALINRVDFEIGGSVIDTHYGKWLTIWRDLTEPNPYGNQGFLNYYGQDPVYVAPNVVSKGLSTSYQKMSYTNRGVPPEIVNTHPYSLNNKAYILQSAPQRAYVPLRFWFCNNPGLALPLIALQNHEVKMNLQFASIGSLFSMYNTFNNNKIQVDTGIIIPNYEDNIKIYGDFVFLDTIERKQFATNSHEYLIEQLQYVKHTGSVVNLPFKHPVKELIWTGSPNTYPTLVSENNGPSTPIYNNEYLSQIKNLYAKVVINGTDLGEFQHLYYYSRYQIWKHHTGFGATCNYDTISVYSFALRPEEHQPSGVLNFTNITNAQLVFTEYDNNSSSGNIPQSALTFDIYAVNYNILKVTSGMGGLVYSK